MKWLLYIVLFITVPALCQERMPLQGKITTGEYFVPNVFIINKTTGVEVKSDASGLFSIAARVGDRLVVYSDRIEVREFAVNELSFKEPPYVMEVNPRGAELKEVVINGINAESLGLVPANQVQHTVAERRLIAAGISAEVGNGMAVSLDGIINLISGRLKMLRKAYETEKKEFAMEKVNGIYLDDQIEAELKVPKEYVRGFLFYVVEDEAFVSALNANNKELAKLNLIRLSEMYRKVLSDGGIKPDSTN